MRPVPPGEQYCIGTVWHEKPSHGVVKCATGIFFFVFMFFPNKMVRTFILKFQILNAVALLKILSLNKVGLNQLGKSRFVGLWVACFFLSTGTVDAKSTGTSF